MISRNVLNKEDAARLDGLERVVRGGLQSFAEVAAALMTIRDDGLYKQYASSFDAYVQIRFEISRAYAYRYIAAAETVKLLGTGDSPIGESVTESVVRPLTQLPPEERKPAYEEAKAAAKAEGKKKPTATHTTAAVRARAAERRAEKAAAQSGAEQGAPEPDRGSTDGLGESRKGLATSESEVGAPTGAALHEPPGWTPPTNEDLTVAGAVQDGSKITTPSEARESVEAPVVATSDVPPAASSDPAFVEGGAVEQPASPKLGAAASAWFAIVEAMPAALPNPASADLHALTDEDETRLTLLGRWCQLMVAARRRVRSAVVAA